MAFVRVTWDESHDGFDPRNQQGRKVQVGIDNVFSLTREFWVGPHSWTANGKYSREGVMKAMKHRGDPNAVGKRWELDPFRTLSISQNTAVRLSKGLIERSIPSGIDLQRDSVLLVGGRDRNGTRDLSHSTRLANGRSDSESVTKGVGRAPSPPFRWIITGPHISHQWYTI